MKNVILLSFIISTCFWSCNKETNELNGKLLLVKETTGDLMKIYEYNELNQLEKLTSHYTDYQPSHITFEYQANGHLAVMKSFNAYGNLSLSFTNQYDLDSNFFKTIVYNPNGNPDCCYSYYLNNEGHVQSFSYYDGDRLSYSVNYEYDSNKTILSYYDPYGSFGGQITIAYDNNPACNTMPYYPYVRFPNNIISESADSVNNDGNMIIQFEGSDYPIFTFGSPYTCVYAYNLQGYPVMKSTHYEKNNTSETTHYEYENRN